MSFPLDYKITLMATPEYNKKVNMYNFIDYDCIPYKYIRTFYPPHLLSGGIKGHTEGIGEKNVVRDSEL